MATLSPFDYIKAKLINVLIAFTSPSRDRSSRPRSAALTTFWQHIHLIHDHQRQSSYQNIHRLARAQKLGYSDATGSGLSNFSINNANSAVTLHGLPPHFLPLLPSSLLHLHLCESHTEQMPYRCERFYVLTQRCHVRFRELAV